MRASSADFDRDHFRVADRELTRRSVKGDLAFLELQPGDLLLENRVAEKSS